MAAGEFTPDRLLPTTGVRPFGGEAIAAYVDPTGRESAVISTVTLMVDFAKRSATFSTHDTRPLANAPIATGGPLDMLGKLDFTTGQNHLSGFAETTDKRMLGPVTGQFFGGAAQELGGTFGLAPFSGDGRERLIGAFGTRGR